MNPRKENDLNGPEKDVKEATQVIQQMRSDADVNKLLNQSRGVFVIPDYAVAALLVGGSGGEGVLIPKNDGEWGQPAFYNFVGISAGIQAGVAAGAIAMILMNDEALQTFNQEDNFSITSSVGLSIINWSGRAEAQGITDGDVVVWTDTEGLFGEASVGISDISWDDEDNAVYYGGAVNAGQIISGNLPPTTHKHGLELGRI